MENESLKVPVSKLIIFFPFTYAIHITEEYCAGERFYNWLSRIANANMTENRFLLLNSIFMFIMILATIIAILRRNHWIPLILASIIMINALLHIFGSIFTYSYSPGLLSAIILWIPLSVWTYRQEYNKTSTGLKITALTIGIVAHIIVSFLALVR